MMYDNYKCYKNNYFLLSINKTVKYILDNLILISHNI
jgi:hypothetical protein